MAEYRDKRGPIFTVIWPGNKKCEHKPLVGIFHSAHDGTTEFEFVGTSSNFIMKSANTPR